MIRAFSCHLYGHFLANFCASSVMVLTAHGLLLAPCFILHSPFFSDLGNLALRKCQFQNFGIVNKFVERLDEDSVQALKFMACTVPRETGANKMRRE